MTTYFPPKQSAEYIFYVALVSQSTGQFQVNPTIASGDWKFSVDGGAFANLATLPAVTPAGGRSVKVTVSSGEIGTGANVVVQGVDAAGSEWDEVIILFQTAARQIDDLATSAALATVQADADNIQTRLPAALSGDGFMKADLKSIEDELTSGNNATLNLKHLIIIDSTGSDYPVFIQADGGGGLDAVRIRGDSNAGGAGVNIAGANGIVVTGDNDIAIDISTFGTNKDGLRIQGSGTGKSINAPDDIAVSDGSLTLAAIAAAVWANATRTLTSFGTLVVDIWALAIETGYTAKQSMRLMLSALAGKLSGAATTNVLIRNVTDAKTRIDATVDSDGNRTAITHDTSD